MVSAVSVELFLSTENITFKISEISFQNISKLSDPSISRPSPNNYPAETCINNAELTDFIQHFKFWSKPESLCVKIVILVIFLDRFENATVISEFPLNGYTLCSLEKCGLVRWSLPRRSLGRGMGRGIILQSLQMSSNTSKWSQITIHVLYERLRTLFRCLPKTSKNPVAKYRWGSVDKIRRQGWSDIGLLGGLSENIKILKSPQ